MDMPLSLSNTAALRQEDALKRLDWMRSPSSLSFHACGMVNADIGYYQLVRLDNGIRVLIFALNLEDLQLKDYAGYGPLLAHPERLYGVNAYEADIPSADIYQDLVNHQTALQRVMLEDYTLVHTGDNIFKSPSVSYAVTAAPDAPGRAHIESAIDALHDNKLAQIEQSGLYGAMRYPHLNLTEPGKPIDDADAIPRVLEHFTGMLGRLMTGKEGIQPENEALNLPARLALRAKIHGARLIDNLARALRGDLNELKEKKITTSVEWFKRVWAIIKIPVVIHDSAVEFGLSVWEAFSVSFSGKAKPRAPESLRPYVRPLGLYTRLNAQLHPLLPEKIETARPLTMAESRLNPADAPVLTADPFMPTTDHVPSRGSIRAPMGSILFAYHNTSLILQPTGVWIAHCHDSNDTYVGYNKDFDTSTNPVPTPILSAWLDHGRILRYTANSHGYTAQSAGIEETHHALKEVFASDHGIFLQAHKPEHAMGPHTIPQHEPRVLRVNGTWVENKNTPQRPDGDRPKPADGHAP